MSSENNMPILSHLKELRSRLLSSIIFLIIGFSVAIFFYDYIIAVLYKPLLVLESSLDNNILYINTVFEGFVVKLKVSVLSGLILSYPLHIFNIIRFVFPGLHKKEKLVISFTLIVSFLFIVGSFFYSYYTILPVSIDFLTSKGFIPDNTGMILSLSGNISYIIQFILVALVIFQLPIILEILLIFNILKRKAMLKSGRYVVVLFFVMSAMLTPPDFVTQIGLALPLSVLYFLTILIAKIFKFGGE